MSVADRIAASRRFVAAQSATEPLHTFFEDYDDPRVKWLPFATTSGTTYQASRESVFSYTVEPAYIAALNLTPLSEAKLYLVTWGSMPISSAFSIGQSTEDADRAVYRLIASLATTTNILFRERLARRLLDLLRASRDEGEEIPISADSLRHFMSFLRSTPALSYPNVTLTPTGNILAQWRKATNKFLGLHFLPNGDIRFVLFAPERHNEYGIVRLSGLVRPEALLPTVEPHGALEWIRDEG